MIRVSVLIAALVVSGFCQGCTVNFKAEKLELEAERQRVEDNCSYRLEDIVVFDGSSR